MKSTIKYNSKLNAIGDKIKKYRKQNHMTQEQLCSKLQLLGIDMSVNSLKKIEVGNRIIKEYELASFTKILNVSADELLKDCVENLAK